MVKKYGFTGETMDWNGKTLHRIRNIKDGRLGGWLESESNLSQQGACWVGGEAMILGSAKVTEDALVTDIARVSGNAHISGYASLLQNATASGCASIRGCAVASGNRL